MELPPAWPADEVWGKRMLAAMFPAAQLSKETGYPAGSLPAEAGGLGWAWYQGQC